MKTISLSHGIPAASLLSERQDGTRKQFDQLRIRRHSTAVLRDPRDRLLVLLAFLHGLVLLSAPSIAVIGLGLWWNSNTIAHNFIHLPFFKRPLSNKLFSAYLSLVLGIPQRLWRDRHLAHHAGAKWRLRLPRQFAIEMACVFSLWGMLAVLAPAFFVQVYLPGVALGLSLCYLQGHYEHARGTVSHYGQLYNRLFFNDGYHVEHHRRPSEHWTALPEMKDPQALSSRWPAVVRWLEAVSLDSLERMAIRFAWLRAFLLIEHERAFRQLAPEIGSVQNITIVGGGIFPRTALILQQIFPDASITIVDASHESIETARPFLNRNITFVQRLYRSNEPLATDLLVIPLSLIGNRQEIYLRPPAPAVLVHDWIWKNHGKGAVVSWLLLKRINLIRR
jgi:hypothetical protein